MRIVFFLLLFLLSVNGWGRCYNSSDGSCQRTINGYSCPLSVGTSCINTKCRVRSFSDCNDNGGWLSALVTCCDDACEFPAELQKCTPPAVWNPNTCQCESDACTEEKAECESQGGSFNGRSLPGETCCRGTCNLCGGIAMNSLYEAKSKICCENGLAPPNREQTCMTDQNVPSGCGVTYSTYGDFTSGGWQCGDPSSDFAAAARFRDQCLNSSSSGANSSSSGANSSSSGANSSASGDCPECPILEEILATLIEQKGVVESIYDCLTSPALCDFGGDSLPSWVREKMEQIISFDSMTANRAGSIDSVVRVIMESQKSLVNSDSLTRETIKDGIDSIVHAISNGVGNDSLGEYIDRIANLIGTNSQMLSHHLDSIKERIPGPILDSILANQKSMFDSFDSAFWSIGNGFEKIDNLTDSAIKYFKQGFHYDSVYSSVYRDSLGEIHDAINSLSNSIGYALGYGDTATTTLRGDLAGIKGGLDDLNSKFVASSVDSGAVGYGSGFIAEGERFGDSLARAVGWLGGLDGVNVDSVFAHSGFDSLSVDSVGRSVDDSLSGLADSLNGILVAQNDSIKRGLPDSLDVWADSLRAYSPFASFDSLIFGQLGAKIPNSNQCPEDCNKWSIDLPRFGLFNFTIDYGLCLGRVPLGGMNALAFIRLLLRIVVVWTCIWIVFNALTRRKD